MKLLVECSACGIASGAERDEYGRLLVKPCRGCVELAVLAQVRTANAVQGAAINAVRAWGTDAAGAALRELAEALWPGGQADKAEGE